MCYSLDLRSLKKPVSKAGLKHGLLLILDHGQVKETHIEEAKDLDQKTVSLNLEPVSAESSSAQIYINSLHSFTDYRAGGYAMSSLKQMTGTVSFLNLPAGDKNCQLETFENCQSQKYLQEVEQQCGCIPWPLDKALRQNKKVYYQGFYNIHFLPQEAPFCSLDDSDCYQDVSRDDSFGCQASCTGLYADVDFSQNAPVNQTEKNKTREMIEALASEGRFLVLVITKNGNLLKTLFYSYTEVR